MVRFTPPPSGVVALFFLYKNPRLSRPEALLEGSRISREGTFSGTFSSPPHMFCTPPYHGPSYVSGSEWATQSPFLVPEVTCQNSRAAISGDAFCFLGQYHPCRKGCVLKSAFEELRRIGRNCCNKLQQSVLNGRERLW